MTHELSAEAFFDLSNYPHKEVFHETTYVWEALKRLASYVNKQSLGKIESEIPTTAYLKYPASISVGKGTIIEPGVYIEGPCIIGANCTIRYGAYIRGYVISGDGCTIGHDTEIKHSILLNHVCASHFNYVGDSILGSDVNLGAGVKCANLRLDQDLVVIDYKGEKKLTDLKKMGLIAGDRAQLGCNCATNPGTLLGKNALCYPCLNVGGFIPASAKVKPAHQNIIEL